MSLVNKNDIKYILEYMGVINNTEEDIEFDNMTNESLMSKFKKEK